MDRTEIKLERVFKPYFIEGERACYGVEEDSEILARMGYVVKGSSLSSGPYALEKLPGKPVRQHYHGGVRKLVLSKRKRVHEKKTMRKV